MPRLAPAPTADEIETWLNREAMDCYCPERLTALHGTLRQLAVWMEELAVVPVAFDDESLAGSPIIGEQLQ
jgi:hypothetical protein